MSEQHATCTHYSLNTTKDSYLLMLTCYLTTDYPSMHTRHVVCDDVTDSQLNGQQLINIRQLI